MADIAKVFKAYDVRGLYGSQIDEDLAWKIGYAAAQFLRSSLSGYERGQSTTNRVIVGHDMRPHSEPLTKALIDGVTSSGAGCIDIGLCDTPMIYFAVNHYGACGGIQVTASHNPVEYNGFKVSGFKARPVGQDSGLAEIQRIVEGLNRMPDGAIISQAQQVDLWDEYRQHILQFLDLKRPMKVVVDASNGMGGKMIPAIFDGADNLEIVPMHFELGQGFVHPPNPLVEANLAWAREAVVKEKADFAIVMDGDADRCMFVDELGNIVGCDLMTALMSKKFLADNPGSMIVYDLRSSKVVPEEVRQAGGVPRRERVGHAFMKKALATGHAVFGGELSGHFYFRDNYNADSGAIAFATAASIISASDRPFSEMVAPLRRYSHSGEINFKVEDKVGKMKEVEEKYSDGEVDHLDGVTVTFEDWWVNVRPSNTEPLLRLSLEARTKPMMEEKVDQLKEILGEPVDH
ncbi:MAG: phosphomannomutase/phosphoglucomutase [Phycisphaerae bacterium]